LHSFDAATNSESIGKLLAAAGAPVQVILQKTKRSPQLALRTLAGHTDLLLSQSVTRMVPATAKCPVLPPGKSAPLSCATNGDHLCQINVRVPAISPSVDMIAETFGALSVPASIEPDGRQLSVRCFVYTTHTEKRPHSGNRVAGIAAGAPLYGGVWP
jgi:hypothetical protein